MKGTAPNRHTRTRNISVQPELDDYVTDLVRSGAFANYSEAVRHALRELRRHESERMLKLQQQPAFVTSLRQAAEGQVRSFDLRTIARTGDA